jgi:hypothetical protein
MLGLFSVYYLSLSLGVFHSVKVYHKYETPNNRLTTKKKKTSKRTAEKLEGFCKYHRGEK